MNRRRFLCVTATAATSAALLGTPAGAVARGAVGQYSPILLFDRRFSDARRFAQAGAALGCEALLHDGDPTDLWFERLAGEIATGRPLLGIGAGGDRFTIEMLAGSAVRRAYHAAHSPARCLTRLGRPDCASTGCDEGSRDRWPERAAVIAVSHARPGEAAVRGGENAVSQLWWPAAGELQSWVLLPRSRATTHI